MMQLKAIFSDLLREFEFELAQPPDTYQNDHSKMVVQLVQPCRARYRRRRAAEHATSGVTKSAAGSEEAGGAFRVRVDLDICQGHAVCASECPEVFEVDPEERKVVLRNKNPGASLRAGVESAVRHCPTRALSIAVSETDPDNQE
jgi:sterol 14-demethylase